MAFQIAQIQASAIFYLIFGIWWIYWSGSWLVARKERLFLISWFSKHFTHQLFKWLDLNSVQLTSCCQGCRMIILLQRLWKHLTFPHFRSFCKHHRLFMGLKVIIFTNSLHCVHHISLVSKRCVRAVKTHLGHSPCRGGQDSNDLWSDPLETLSSSSHQKTEFKIYLYYLGFCFLQLFLSSLWSLTAGDK